MHRQIAAASHELHRGCVDVDYDFVSALLDDPLGFDAGDSNLYRYVNNGPTNATDPSGMDPPDPQDVAKSPWLLKENWADATGQMYRMTHRVSFYVPGIKDQEGLKVYINKVFKQLESFEHFDPDNLARARVIEPTARGERESKVSGPNGTDIAVTD